jgi:hypothetical protein
VEPAAMGKTVERLAQALVAHPDLVKRLTVRTAIDADEHQPLQDAIERLLALAPPPAA